MRPATRPRESSADVHTDRPAVLFDLDGTLLDSVYQHVIAWKEALESAGIPLSIWRIHRRIGMSGGLFLRALVRWAGRSARALWSVTASGTSWPPSEPTRSGSASFQEVTDGRSSRPRAPIACMTIRRTFSSTSTSWASGRTSSHPTAWNHNLQFH